MVRGNSILSPEVMPEQIEGQIDSHDKISATPREIIISNLPVPAQAEAMSDWEYQILTSQEITPEIVQEISDLFRLTFNNTFPEYVVCQKCEEKMPAWQVYGVEPSSYIPLAVMDNLPKLPPCPCCHQTMELFHDPERTEVLLAKKFEKDAHLLLLRKPGDKQILGATFGYLASLTEIYENEWKYKFTYTKQPQTTRDYSQFLAAALPALREDLQLADFPDPTLCPDSQVFCWNCGFLDPSIQMQRILPLAIPIFFRSLPKDYQKLALIGETIEGSKAHRLLSLGGYRSIKGVLGKSYVLLTGAFSTISHNFLKPLTKPKDPKVG